MSEEEMKALVEMNNMLKHENTKLKQDKQVLQNELNVANKKLDKIKEYIVDKKDIYKNMTFDFDFNTILEIIESE